MTDPLILIDMSNLCFRSHFAFKGLLHQGTSTACYYGVLNAILGLKKQFGDRLVFCWDYGLPGDEPKPNWRKAIFPEYKSKRLKNDEEIAAMMATLPRLFSTLRDMGWANVGVAGLEADDIIGILTHTEPSLIFSTDRDLYQLLEGDRVKIVVPRKTGSDYQLITQLSVEQEYGIRVSQWARYLALGGDSSDDIHVLPGIGPKKALKMVQEGANPELCWTMQPFEFRLKYMEKCVGCWHKVEAAYKVASIPRQIGDSRIASYINGTQPIGLDSDWTKYYNRNGKGDALKAITGFCSDFGLLEHLSKRKEFL